MTFVLPEASENRLIASRALILHRSVQNTAYSSDGITLITSHPIHQAPEGPVIGAGSLISLSDQEILRDILTNNTESEAVLLPKNVLMTSARRLAWYVPGRVRSMYFRYDKKMRRMAVPWPTLLFYVDCGKLSVCALSSTNRPTAKTRVYHAPLANIYADGGVCTGSAELPDGWRTSNTASWESVVFETAFSHVNQPHTLRTGKNREVNNAAHFAFWHKLDKDKTRRFPAKALVPTHHTLKNWLGND